MSTKSTIDKQLEKLLSGNIDEVNSTPSDLQDEEPEEFAELVPVKYEDKSTSLTLQNQDTQEDYEFTRSNLYGLVGRTNAALDLALKLSAMSEHPRALEVVATLIKTSSDVSKDLLKLQAELKNIEKGSKTSTGEPGSSYTQVNNNYYGSEKELDDLNQAIDDLPDE